VSEPHETLIHAGHLFCFSSGEYSDYGYQGHFLALEEINRARYNELIDEAKASETAKEAEADSKGEWYFADPRGAFIGSLIRAGLVMAITCPEIHLGSYGELDHA
jgi:hypothetical protein